MLFESVHLFIDITQYILEGFFSFTRFKRVFSTMKKFKFSVILFCYLVCLLIE